MDDGGPGARARGSLPDDFGEGRPHWRFSALGNLPAAKMVEPRYTGLQSEDIPSFHPDEGAATVN